MSAAGRRPRHWAATLNHRTGSVAYLMIATTFAAHFADTRPSALVWGLMLLHFVVCPHLNYGLSLNSRDPLQHEGRRLALESVLLGTWVGYLGFPVWPSFMVLLGNLVTLMAFFSYRGLLASLLGALAGMALGCAIHGGLRWLPDTSLAVTMLSMASLAIYMCAFANSAHNRSVTLSRTRRALRDRETDLETQLHAVETLQQQLSELANRDPLTGLYNRRYLHECLERVLHSCQRRQTPWSVLLLDIDHFKRINDQLGHTRGDEVLRRVSDWLSQAMRASDICCRYGGEEFLVVLADTDANAALACAHRCREAIAAQDWSGSGVPFGVTLSIGVASDDTARLPAAALIELADQALYRAKHGGRNQVQAAPPPQALQEPHPEARAQPVAG